MKIIYNKKIPSKGFTAINLFGVVFARKKLSAKLINHEAIHTAQMKELLYIFFYLIYSIEWLVRLVQYRNSKEAYYNISFEREAYANDDNLNYLKTRNHFAVKEYLEGI